MIQPFTLSALDQILKIEAQSFPKSPYDRTTFIYFYSIYPDTFWVYASSTSKHKESQILGYIIFTKEGHIISIAVHPQYRRKGIGKELLKKAIDTVNLKKVWAEVRRSNHGAQAFYRYMRFRLTGEVPNYYGNEDALIFQWTPEFQSQSRQV